MTSYKDIVENKSTTTPPVTSVSAPVPGREKEMIVNNTGGYTFEMDIWSQLHRFIVLGGRSASYYEARDTIAKRGVDIVKKCLKADGKRTIDIAVEISQSGRAPKNDEAILVLAIASADEDEIVRRYALAQLSSVCRIPTHLFDFLTYAQNFRGWGTAFKKAVARWYTEKDLRPLAMQMVKYRQRNGWTQADVLRQSHPKTDDEARSALFALALNDFKADFEAGEFTTERRLPKASRSAAVEKQRVVIPTDGDMRIVEGYLKARAAKSEGEVVKLIQDYRLTHEMVPTEFQSSAKVQEALLQFMPLGATIRNLGKMTALGVASPMSDNVDTIVERITNRDQIRRARMHPINILNAMAVYKRGGGFGSKSKFTWTANTQIVDALDEAFYMAFEEIEPSGKKIVICLDISGSMGVGYFGGSSGQMALSPREITAAMSMAVARSEKKFYVIGFSNQIIELDISPRMRLDKVVKNISNLPFGYTNPGLAIEWASKKGIAADAFVVYTDNEVNGGQHASSLIKKYRKDFNRDTRLVVCATQATPMSIADPKDAGMLDLAGFDSSVPAIISDFVAGRI